MASAVSENMATWKAKLDKLLHEKNFATETLEKIEQKTGVRRLYIALGKKPHHSLNTTHISELTRKKFALNIHNHTRNILPPIVCGGNHIHYFRNTRECIEAISRKAFTFQMK